MRRVRVNTLFGRARDRSVTLNPPRGNKKEEPDGSSFSDESEIREDPSLRSG
jgi:hypothetical protein